MVILSTVMAGAICLPILVAFRQIGRVWRGRIGFSNIFLAVGFRESRIRETGSRVEERGSLRPTGFESRHRGPALAGGVGGCGGTNRGVDVTILGC